MKNTLTLPLICSPGIVGVPHCDIDLPLRHLPTLQAIQDESFQGPVFLCAMRNGDIAWPRTMRDLERIGCIAYVKQTIESKREDEFARVFLHLGGRAKLLRIEEKKSCFLVVVEVINEEDDLSDIEREVLRDELLQSCYAYFMKRIKSVEQIRDFFNFEEGSNLQLLAYQIASLMPFPPEIRQAQLDMASVREFVYRLIFDIQISTRSLSYRDDLEEQVRQQLDKNQRDYFLREEMKIIRRELNEDEDPATVYVEKLSALAMPESSREHVLREAQRLSRYPAEFPEAAQIQNYLDLVLDLPWGKLGEDQHDIDLAQKILDRDHYALEKVKERIIEYLAIFKFKSTALKDLDLKLKSARESKSKPDLLTSLEEERRLLLKAPILCLVGPPGVGKTSIVKSIAEALGRPMVRMSLGGVSDEADIRGHRRTYIGSIPGRLIKAMQEAKVDNPLILMDEIDKLRNDYKGDPAAALLEVLDPAQNQRFIDHYLEIPYDLSRVFFITTANSLDQIPEALRDRLEIIHLSGYTEPEKLEIARRHLLPRLLSENAMTKSMLLIRPAAILEIVRRYTHEAGVRQLERLLSKIIRKSAVELMSDSRKQVRVTSRNLENYLGKADFDYERISHEDLVGVCTGLAWTPYGGDILSIEVNVLPGSGKIEMTGSLGDVMKESVQVAVGYLRSEIDLFQIPEDFYKSYDLHIHVPEGAIPKDGPSAGITLATAMCSALSKRPIRHAFAMTGELTLRGHVLAIGGLKEKLIAAQRSGIREVIIPKRNQKDLEDIPESVLQELTIHPVKRMEEVLKLVLMPREED